MELIVMHLEEKIRHHYVSRLYLDNWTVEHTSNSACIWALNKKNGNIYNTTNLSNVAQKNRFYKVVVDDIVWGMLKYILEPHQHDTFVAQTLRALNPLLLINEYRKRQLEHYEKLAAIETNFLEDRYADLEDLFDHTIKTISAAGRAFPEAIRENTQRHYQSLMLLFASQYFRTIHARERINNITQESFLHCGDVTHKLSSEQVDTVTKVNLYVESMRLAENLTRSRFVISLDYNTSDIDLITTSTPALGHVDENRAHRDDISSFKGHMPLTPKINMRLHKMSLNDHQFEFGTITKQPVLSVNRLRAKASELDIYATSEKQLQHVRCVLA